MCFVKEIAMEEEDPLVVKKIDWTITQMLSTQRHSVITNAVSFDRQALCDKSSQMFSLKIVHKFLFFRDVFILLHK